MLLRDIYYKIGYTWFMLLAILLLVSVFSGLGMIVGWEPQSLILFVFIWGIVPCFSWAVNTKAVSTLLTNNTLQTLRCILIGIVVVFSILFYIFWDDLRDSFGHACVRGYSVHYTDEYDDEGGYYEQAHVSANNWVVEKLLIFSQILILLPSAAVNGVLTWKGITKEIQLRELKKPKEEVDGN